MKTQTASYVLEGQPHVVDSPICAETLTKQLVEFWTTLFDKSSGYLVLQSGFRIGPVLRGITERKFAWPEAVNEAVSWVAKEARYGRDVYQVPFLASGARRLSSETSVVVADLDRTCLDRLPTPSLLVETSPGRRQAYWFLTAAVPGSVSSQLVSRIQRECQAKIQESTMARVPGIPNRKYHDAKVEILESSGKRYSPSHFAALLGFDLELLQQRTRRVGLSLNMSPMIGRATKVFFATATIVSAFFGLNGTAGTLEGPKTVVAAPPQTASSSEIILINSQYVVEVSEPVRVAKATKVVHAPDPVVDLPITESQSDSPVSQIASSEFDLVRGASQVIFDQPRRLP